ncbi:unnamed protein product [Owenia fusiformis]|uniref:Uncharacterized protein n=1 Tax=Owenia fusiformis TaxID=6347 RepID=A0A8J1URW4_OWEFU|nr:unnamed protein product [Owenia fusiformis]
MATFRTLKNVLLIFLIILMVNSGETKSRKNEESSLISETSDNSIRSQIFGDIKRAERKRRGTDVFSSQDAQWVLSLHNSIRASVGASDMRYMVWDNEVASLAQQWADRCDFVHGQVPNSLSLGQNLYMTTGTFNANSSVKSWENERFDYTYATNKCRDGKACGHYTQIVWDDSFKLGCGATLCPTLTDSKKGRSWSDATLVVCNYNPPGNFPRQPYTVGEGCSDCGPGLFCFDGFCRDCFAEGITSQCTCGKECANCGTVTNECSCSCPAGWWGNSCQDACVDVNENCNGYGANACDDFYAFMTKNCAAHCGRCVGATGDGTNVCPKTTEKPTTTTKKPTTTTKKPTTTTKKPTTTTKKPTTTTKKPTTTTKKPTTTTKKPTTTTKKPTTTTTKKPTTTKRPTKVTTTEKMDPCESFQCQNGGVAVESQSQCRCQCTNSWYGRRCQHSRNEASRGVQLTATASAGLWQAIWGTIRNKVADFLTRYCNNKFRRCCPDKGNRRNNDFLVYATENNIISAKGYPTEVDVGQRKRLTVVFYAEVPVDNPLCSDGDISTQRVRRGLKDRFNRAVSDVLYLDQETLLDALKESEASLQESLEDCCNTTLEALELPVVPSIEQNNEGPSWEIFVIVAMGLVMLVILAILLAACIMYIRRSKSKNQDKNSDAKVDTFRDTANLKGPYRQQEVSSMQLNLPRFFPVVGESYTADSKSAIAFTNMNNKDTNMNIPKRFMYARSSINKQTPSFQM